MWRINSACSSESINLRQIDIDLERHADLQPIVEDPARRVGARRWVELVYIDDRSPVDILHSPEVGDARFRIQLGFAFPIPGARLRRHDLDHEDYVSSLVGREV